MTKTMTSGEVAEAAGIWHTQVSRYAARLGVAPVSRTAARTEWPATLAAQIVAAREVRDAREGAEADDLRVEGDPPVLLVSRTRAEGTRRVLARIPLTAANRRALRSLLK